MNEKLRKELLEMEKKDQEVRFYIDEEVKKIQKPSQKLWDKVWEVDSKNTIRLQEIIKEFGWPTFSLVGKDGARAAWLIVQHASHESEFQEFCLELLEEAMLNGEAEKNNYAYLLDRILMNNDEPQVFGTQFQVLESGDVVSYKIEDFEGLEERRKKYNLEPFETYKKKMQNFEK